jgi:hypothetical protein
MSTSQQHPTRNEEPVDLRPAQQWFEDLFSSIFAGQQEDDSWDNPLRDWPTGPDPAWMHHDEIPIEPTPLSAYGHRWQESFKKGKCPHGMRMLSPEDQCNTCVIECQEMTPAHVNLVLAPDYWKDDLSKMQQLQVGVKKLDPRAQIPKQATKGDAGYDL